MSEAREPSGSGSKTGTYRLNPQTQKMEKISDRIPAVSFDSVSLPAGEHREGGYYSENLDCFIRSRRHKRDVLKRMGLAEVADSGSHQEFVKKQPELDLSSIL